MAVGSGGELEWVVGVETDVLVRERRDELDLAGGDELAAVAELVEDALGVPGDDGVDDDRQAEGLLALLLKVSTQLKQEPKVQTRSGDEPAPLTTRPA